MVTTAAMTPKERQEQGEAENAEESRQGEGQGTGGAD